MSFRCRGLCLAICAVSSAAQVADTDPWGWRQSLDQAKDRLAAPPLGLNVVAFGDVLAAPDDEGRKRLDWGSFELDLSWECFDTLEASAAVVTDRDGTRLGAGFLDFHPFGGTIAPRGRLWVEKGFHIQAGRFDVPFGNDWQFFASKDSPSISRPLTTGAVMDGGYNDVGLRILGNDGTVNINAFVLRGFGNGRLLGGRIGITPFGNPFSLKGAREPKSAEFGFSFLYDTDAARRKRETAWAADAEGRFGEWRLRAEYLHRRREAEDLQGPTTRHGWHLTQEYTWPGQAVPTTVFLRYERIRSHPEEAGPGDGHDGRIAAGASITLAGIIQIKAEWQHLREASAATRRSAAYSPHVWLAQLVVVF